MIPEDIRRTATQCFADVDFVDTVPEAIQIIAAAEAIMAERERCAMIALSRRSLPSADLNSYETALAIDIASAIRNGGSK